MSKLIEMVKYARIPLQVNARAGDQVLIITDTNVDPLVWQALAAAAYELEMHPTVALSPPPPYHHANPTPPAARAMEDADLTLCVTSRAVIHSPALHAAMKAGRKCIAMEEVTPDMLREGACTADILAMMAHGRKYRALWTQGKEVRVTSALGTNLRASIQGRPGYVCAGQIERQEGIDLYCAAFPDGEVGIAPVEDTVEGVIVWDTTAHQVGRLREPIELEVSGGRAIRFSGGDQAEALQEYLLQHGDGLSFNVGEISIGLNPNSPVTGIIRVDKKLAGSCHIALGMNADVGGKLACKTHIDGVIRRPTVAIDGQVVVDGGRLVV